MTVYTKLFTPSNTTLTAFNLGFNRIDAAGATALSAALQGNTTLTSIDLHHNPIFYVGAIALVEALKVNTTLTKLEFSGTSELKKEIYSLLESNRQLKLQNAAASLDLLVRHSPGLKNVDVPFEILPQIAEHLTNETLAIFGQEWRDAFRTPPRPITTTTTNTTATTTTTTTTTSPTPLTIAPASVPPAIAGQTTTAADINALLAHANPVVALSGWIDGQANPAAALNWVDPANGFTLLHYAVTTQQGAVVLNLLLRGIDRTKVNHNNQTAAQLARERADFSSSQSVAVIALMLQ